MNVHRPNQVPKQTRVLLVIAIVVIGLYATAHLLTGYVYVPAKRGGFLLSGASTLMVVAAQLFIALGCAAKIIDHYDTRQNEHSYQRFIRISFKVSLTLLVLAPFAQIVIALLHIAGIDAPSFHGLAREFTFYSPSLKAYESVMSIDKALLMPLGITAAVLLFFGWLTAKLKIDSTTRIQMLLIGSGFVLMSVLFMNMFMHDFFVGQTELGRSSNRTLVSVMTDPAKFNAVLLTKFSLVGFMLTFGFLGVLGGLVGPANKHSWQQFWARFRDQ